MYQSLKGYISNPKQSVVPETDWLRINPLKGIFQTFLIGTFGAIGVLYQSLKGYISNPKQSVVPETDWLRINPLKGIFQTFLIGTFGAIGVLYQSLKGYISNFRVRDRCLFDRVYQSLKGYISNGSQIPLLNVNGVVSIP